MNGWVRVNRDFTRWEWYSDINVARVFFHLLLTVNHKAVKWQGQVIQPGERVVSRANLAEETSLSVQEIRTALKKMKSTNEITIRTTNKYTIISLINWRKYQGWELIDNQQFNQLNNKSLTNNQPSINHQLTTNNNDNNENNENNENNISVSSVSSDCFVGKEGKKRHGQFNNVLLTDDEVKGLKERFGSGYTEKLESFSHSLAMKGYKYSSHYLAMLKWFKDDVTLKPQEDLIIMGMNNVPVFESVE